MQRLRCQQRLNFVFISRNMIHRLIYNRKKGRNLNRTIGKKGETWIEQVMENQFDSVLEERIIILEKKGKREKPASNRTWRTKSILSGSGHREADRDGCVVRRHRGRGGSDVYGGLRQTTVGRPIPMGAARESVRTWTTCASSRPTGVRRRWAARR